MKQLWASTIGITALLAVGCTVSTAPANELEFSENLAEERRQIGLDAVEQIQLPEGFELKHTSGTPAEAPSLSNQNNPFPASFTYHIDVDTDVPEPVWINQLKAEIESHGQLEGYGYSAKVLSPCSSKVHTMHFRHVDTDDALQVGYNRDRPSELTFYYRYSSAGSGSFGPVDQLFRHEGPACIVES